MSDASVIQSSGLLSEEFQSDIHKVLMQKSALTGDLFLFQTKKSLASLHVVDVPNSLT